MLHGESSTLRLDGESLTVESLARAARNPQIRVEFDPAAWTRVELCRSLIDEVVGKYESALSRGEDATPFMVYGVTTGFGEFKSIPIPREDLIALQENILLSHSVGFGDNAFEDDPANYFAADVIRAALISRINTFAKGRSGVRRVLVEYLIEMVNAGIVPLVPTRGSVGSSGDLCPLSHMFVLLLGHGSFYVVTSAAEIAGGLRACVRRPARELADVVGPPPRLSHKEGLALTNGATVSSAGLALAVYDAEMLANTCDAAVALSIEALCGRTRAFDDEIHMARGMTGQRQSAANLRAMLADSKLTDRADEVQDAYSLRCAPQVHGATRDAIAYAKRVVTAELNAATDNPLFFPGHTTCDVKARRERGDSDAEIGDQLACSAGNFHGQPIALASDFLSIAVAELANIAERRTQALLDANHNRGLWPNLTARPGVNSGYMIAQYSASALVSENKVLAHPASVDSIPTSANTEDHVAMATHASRKARSILANAQAVVAVELLVAAQAVDVRVALDGDANPGSSSRVAAGAKADTHVNEAMAAQAAKDRLDRFMQQFANAGDGHSAVLSRLGRGTRIVYRTIREAVGALGDDRYLEPDVRRIRGIVATGGIVAALVNEQADFFRSIDEIA